MSRPDVPKIERAAGGVVVRQGTEGTEIAVGEQTDRLSGAATLRLPKGKLEAGETPEQAALREVLEESGLTARIVSRLPQATYTYDTRRRRVAKEVDFFLMRFVEGEPEPRDGEMDRVYWCTIERAARELTFETERRVVQAAREALNRTAPGDPKEPGDRKKSGAGKQSGDGPGEASGP